MTALISELHPDLQPLCVEWIENCHAVGLKVSITFTWRSVDDQNILYAQGRTAPGNIVTNAKGSDSLHTFTFPDGTPASKAFDWACFDENAKYITDGSDPVYAQAGAIGKKLGLEWGGDFPGNFKDFDHLQLPLAPIA